jgi:hypothetical protein
MPDERELTRVITDDEFQRQLLLLRRTRRFLIAEGVPAATNAGSESPFSLGRLNLIRARSRVFLPERSRPPTLEDWLLLEEKQDGLQRFFNTELQRRFHLQATQRIITGTPIFLLLVAGIALALAVCPPTMNLNPLSEGGTPPDVIQAGWRFGAYLGWTSCLGGLGAIGFLAVNSLAIQDDATFDISNQSLVAMRIVLGALFGCIVPLPFCFPYFKEFTAWVLNGGDVNAGRGVLLLVPFLLGFSTTLVMAVLNRMISGIETMFGIERRAAKGARRTTDTPAISDIRPDLAAAAPSRGGDVTRLPVERSGATAGSA